MYIIEMGESMKKLLLYLFICMSFICLSSCGDDDDDDDDACNPYKVQLRDSKLGRQESGFIFSTTSYMVDAHPYYTTTYKKKDVEKVFATCKSLLEESEVYSVSAMKFREENGVCFIDEFECYTSDGDYSYEISTTSSKYTEFKVAEFIKDECKETIVVDNFDSEYTRVKFSSSDCFKEPAMGVIYYQDVIEHPESFMVVLLDNQDAAKFSSLEELLNKKIGYLTIKRETDYLNN